MVQIRHAAPGDGLVLSLQFLLSSQRAVHEGGKLNELRQGAENMLRGSCMVHELEVGS